MSAQWQQQWVGTGERDQRTAVADARLRLTVQLPHDEDASQYNEPGWTSMPPWGYVFIP